MRTFITFTLSLLIATSVAFAHCDSLTGPVVVDARAALDSGKVDRVLKWIPAADEQTVRAAFAQALKVRGQSDAARELADQWFFETVVRLHRTMEGEPFTGLRPAGWRPEPVIDLADNAVNTGKVDDLEASLVSDVRSELRARLQRVREAREHRDDSIPAGRAYVEAYLQYLKYVESLQGAGGAHP